MSLLGFFIKRLVRQMRRLALAEQASAAVAAAAAARSTEQFRSLAETATEMIVTCDTRRVRLYVSPASHDLIGYKPETLIGKSPGADLHPEDTTRAMEGSFTQRYVKRQGWARPLRPDSEVAGCDPAGNIDRRRSCRS